MRKYALCVLFITSSLAAAQDKTSPAKGDAAKLQGAWTVLTVEQNGKPDPKGQGARIVFAGDTFTRTAGNQIAKGTFKLDATAKPPAIDTTYTEGPEKGKTFQGIYSLEGDTLKLCYSQRPTEFNS